MVAHRTYQPDRGDLIWLDFTPNAGTEQGGRRPALVLSGQDFNIATGLVLVCPITTKDKINSFDVPLPKGVRLKGVILSSQIRSLDWIARNADFHGKADTNTMCEVLGRIEAILGIEL